MRSCPDGNGEPTARRVAFNFIEFFDAASSERRTHLVRAVSEPTDDRRYDAILAALVEHLCARWGIDTPVWVEEPSRFLDEWWFVAGLRNLEAIALAQSPISFARRGVFVCDGALTYA
jgi:hypothetical protein